MRTKLFTLALLFLSISIRTILSQTNWLYDSNNYSLKTSSSLMITGDQNRTYLNSDGSPNVSIGGGMPALTMIADRSLLQNANATINFGGLPNKSFVITYDDLGLSFGFIRETYDPSLSLFSINGGAGNRILNLTPDGKSVVIGNGGNISKLQVNGDIDFTGNLFKNGQLVGSSQWGSNGSHIYFNSGNVGIGVVSPSASLHIRTATANLLVENSGIEGAYITVRSGRYNRPAITTYKQVDTEYWHAGILYDENGNQNYSIGTTSAFLSSKLTIQSNGNIGFGAYSPRANLQIGEINGAVKKLMIPGAYNFEQLNLTMGANGNGELEFVTHSNSENSGGIKLFSPDGAHLCFQTASPTNSYNTLNYQTKMVLTNGGYLGIGTTSPDYPLDVIGIIRAHRVKINLLKTADFVFAPTYELPSLKDVEIYINTHKHLEGIPSAPDMEKDGIEVGDMAITLLQKIEELTIYSIQLKKENEAQKNLLENQSKISSNLQQQVLEMKKEMEEMKKTLQTNK